MYEELLEKIEELQQLVSIAICSDRAYCLSYPSCEGCGTNKYIKEVMSEFEDLKLIIERMEMVDDNN